MDELISKRAVIEAIEKARANVGHNLERSIGKTIIEILDDVGRDVDRLPSAEPKVGKWERHYSRPNVYADLFWHCSECGYRSSDNWADKFNFCPHCGADMRGDKNA